MLDLGVWWGARDPMGEFVCKVADARGQVSVQVETATSEAELRRRLAEKGLFLYSVRTRALTGVPWRWPAFHRRRISANDFLLFNQQFVTLVRAGLPILRALDLLADRTARPALRAVLNDVRQRLRGGASLSGAFQAQGIFSEVYIASLVAGERSGNLPGVLDYFIGYLKVSGNVRRRLLAALVYPALLVGVAAGVLTFVTLYVIPRFAELYADLNIPLPSLTVAVITFALNVRASVFILAVAAVLFLAAILLVSRSEAGAQALDRARLRIPVVGGIVLKFRLAQFSRTLSTLLAGGIPLVPSLGVAAGALESPLLRHAVGVAALRVREGQSLHAALASTGIIPALVTEMVEVGEGTGALPQMLTSVAEFYEEELSARLTTLMALLEPLLLLSVAAVIFVILVALYLPIFSVGTLVR